MRFFGVQVVLFLLFAQVWLHRCPLHLQCSKRHLSIFVGKDFIRNGMKLKSHQVILGNGCGITSEESDHFYLHYSFWDCGIQAEISDIMETFMTFIKFSSLDYFHGGDVQISLACSIFREIEEPSFLATHVASPLLKTQFNRAPFATASTSQASSSGNEKTFPFPVTEPFIHNFMVPSFLTKFPSLTGIYGNIPLNDSSVYPKCF
ncbi:uncharacterized protein LOC130455171 isoform X2 [Monodelphis domestica]|uniref:uncharacterized protein LOC130455171 isoform X2 n=1 Tax=Monodelphis domestica TaxID=13616 RepID=UPI0024E24851|nr:uncharacterized protein LOC130455171 isoform X2 [Monodelphis domestica]